MAKSKQRTGILLVMSLVLAVIVLAACAPSQPATTTPATTTTTPKPGEFLPGVIKLGYAVPMTGPTASLTTQYAEGVLDAAEYVNSNGGVAGHKVEWVIVDTVYDMSKTLAGLKKLKEQDKCMVIGNIHSGVAIMIAQQNDALPKSEKVVLWISPNPAAEFNVPLQDNYTFTNYPSYFILYRDLVKYIKSDLWKGSGTPKIAYCIFDNATGQSMAKGADVAIKDAGWGEPVLRTWCEVSATDVNTQMTKVKETNPDFVIIGGTTGNNIAMLKDAKRVGGLENAIFLGIHDLAGNACIQATKPPLGLGDNVYTYNMVSNWTDSSEGVKIIKEVNGKLHPDIKTRDQSYMIFFPNGTMLCEGVANAIDKVGYDKLDATAIRDGLEQIRSYDFHGMMSKVNIDKTNHNLVWGMQIVKRSGDSFSPVTEWLTPAPYTAEQMTPAFWK